MRRVRPAILALLVATALACAGAAPPATTDAAPTTTTISTITTTTTTAPTTTTMAAATEAGPPAPPPLSPPAPLVDVLDHDPTIVVALNKLSSDNFTGGPLPGYEANRAFLLPEAAEALASVQARLRPLRLGVKVWDAYRPYRATQAMVDWAHAQGRSDLVGPYIASLSYHNSGQAVDLTLIERDSGEELDMGTPYETFSPDAHTANAAGEVAANRAILVDAMHAEGFSNYEGEWWHFNFFVPGAVVLDVPIR